MQILGHQKALFITPTSIHENVQAQGKPKPAEYSNFKTIPENMNKSIKLAYFSIHSLLHTLTLQHQTTLSFFNNIIQVSQNSWFSIILNLALEIS